jgi:hypothetical protein
MKKKDKQKQVRFEGEFHDATETHSTQQMTDLSGHFHPLL